MSSQPRPISPTPIASPDLPPPRARAKGLKPVRKPLSNVRLINLIYALAALGVLLCALYAYRLAQVTAEVGGWWNLALGKRPPQLNPNPQATGHKLGWKGQPKPRTSQSSSSPDKRTYGDESIEERINALAEALGMP